MAGISGISVIIPTYNSAKFIEETLDSLVRQTLQPVEIIIVDDCSTDRTVEIVEKWSEQKGIAVSLLKSEQNSGGPAIPINRGVSAAKGELIAVLDHDDVWLEDKLSRQYEIMESNRDVVLVHSMASAIDADGKIIRENLHDRYCGKGWEEDVKKRALPKGAWYHIPSNRAFFLLIKYSTAHISGFSQCLFRKKDFDEMGGLATQHLSAADVDLFCRLAQRGNFAFLPEILTLKREHEGGVVKSRQIASHEETLTVRSQYMKRLSLSQKFSLLDFSFQAFLRLKYGLERKTNIFETLYYGVIYLFDKMKLMVQVVLKRLFPIK